uniref:Uncharacterized protein n=1 Tax=Anopheles albimanus TaxID=7167 RepID=A0A182F1U3_ANOAL
MQFWGFILLCLAAFAFFAESHFFASGQSNDGNDLPLDRSVPHRRLPQRRPHHKVPHHNGLHHNGLHHGAGLKPSHLI